MKRHTALCSTLCLVPALIAFSSASAAELKIEGGAPAIEKILKPISQPFEKATGIKLTMVASGPKAALTNLEAGSIDAAIGPGVDDWMKFMAKENASVKDPGTFQMTVVGEDRVVMIVNKDNPVSTLSGDQVKGIFTGKIDNWKQLGGPAPVLVVLGKLIMPAVTIFYGKTLDGEAPVKDVMEVATARDVKAGVASTSRPSGSSPQVRQTTRSRSRPARRCPSSLPWRPRPILLPTRQAPGLHQHRRQEVHQVGQRAASRLTSDLARRRDAASPLSRRSEPELRVR